MPRARLIALIATLGLVALACTGLGAATSAPASAAPSTSLGPTPGASTPPGGSPGQPGSSALVFRAAYQGGLIAPKASRARIPFLSVFADGRIMTAGAVPAIYPGPLMPSVVFRSIGPDGAANVLKAAADAGLTGPDASYPGGPVLDVPATVVTVVHDGRPTVTTFGFLDGGPGVSADPSDPAARVKAATAALIAGLSGNATFGGTVGPEGTYQPLGFQLFVTPGPPLPLGALGSSDPGLSRPPVAWPLSSPLASFGRPDPLGGDGGRVGTLTGADAATVGPILASASQLTGFTSGGTQWTIVARPLLPDEVAALGG